MTFRVIPGPRQVRAVCPGSAWPFVILCLAPFLAGCDDGSGGILDGSGVLKGTISIEPGTRVDRDTALAIIEDGSELFRDDEDNPQYQDARLRGSITLGGYVSGSSGQYATGFSYPLDEEDVFRLHLEEGETVSIKVWPARGLEAPKLVFELRELENGGESSEVKGADVSLVAEQDGTHELSIRAEEGEGPARYTLRIEQTEATTASSASRDFVPGEAVITTESMQRAGQMRAQSQAPMSAHDQASLGANRLRVQMPDAAQARAQSQSPQKASRETLKWIRELQEAEGVASATPNFIVQSQSTVQGAREKDWHQALIQINAAWDKGYSDGEVDLAILDTGVLKEASGDWHPGLAPNIECDGDSCFDAIDGGSNPADASGDFHGTHVAGIAAAADGQDFDSDDHLQGIAYNANLIPVRVLDGSVGTLADVIAGVDWVVNGGAPRADIMNLSLGGLSRSPALESALAEADEAGVLVTAAAGNRGDRLEFYPAAYPSVFAVASVNCARERSGFSSFGDWLTLSAPGGGNANGCSDEDRVYSTFGDSDGSPNYFRLAGTSMAAPQVAGVFALMIEHYGAQHLEPDVLRAMVREGLLTDSKEGEAGAFDLQTGRGVLDAGKAFGDALKPEEYAAFAPTRDWLRLSDGQPRQSVAFERVGHAGTDLEGFKISLVDEPRWLEAPESTGNREFEIALSDDVALGRAYQGLLQVTYQMSGNDVSYQIPISAITEDAEENRNAGVHFVQLIREEDVGAGELEPARETRAEFSKGRYEFEIDTSDLEPGNYLLIAGSDIDNNGLIGEVGEAYAVWTESGDDSGFAKPDPIRVTQRMDRSVEMTTSFLSADDTGVPAGRVLRRLRD